ncbi:MAG: hypothetical protein V4736_02555 [Bdellovibrionota bacterium]
MKFFLFLFLLGTSSLATGQEYSWDPNLTQHQRQFANDLSKPWPEISTATPAQAFESLRPLILDDGPSKQLLETATQTLNAHGIKDVSEIIKYCKDGDQFGASGYFDQSGDTIAARISIPGVPVQAWSAADQAKMKSAYSVKIMKFPFMEILAVSTSPEICIKKGETIRAAYDVFVHELVHFLFRDIFSDVESKFAGKFEKDILEFEIMRPGGEFQAFVTAIGAEIRLLKKMGITNPNATRPNFSNEGEILDPAPLKSELISSYKPYYENPETQLQQEEDRKSAVAWRLEFLKNFVAPYLNTLNNPKLKTELQIEIKKVEALL